MKFIIVLVALVAVCSGAPLDGDVESTVLRDNRENDGINGYQFGFETSNGIVRQENGALKQVGDANVIFVSGEASWTAPDGSPVSLKFTADDTGFHPVL